MKPILLSLITLGTLLFGIPTSAFAQADMQIVDITINVQSTRYPNRNSSETIAGELIVCLEDAVVLSTCLRNPQCVATNYCVFNEVSFPNRELKFSVFEVDQQTQELIATGYCGVEKTCNLYAESIVTPSQRQALPLYYLRETVVSQSSSQQVRLEGRRLEGDLFEVRREVGRLYALRVDEELPVTLEVLTPFSGNLPSNYNGKVAWINIATQVQRFLRTEDTLFSLPSESISNYQVSVPEVQLFGQALFQVPGGIGTPTATAYYDARNYQTYAVAETAPSILETLVQQILETTYQASSLTNPVAQISITQPSRSTSTPSTTESQDDRSLW